MKAERIGNRRAEGRRSTASGLEQRQLRARTHVGRASARQAAAICLLLLLAACGASQSSSTPAATTSSSAAPAGPRVVFPDGYAVSVEIAADDPTRQQGLMYRDRLPETAGMLFFFDQSAEYPFWMKNTLIPLDMIWIDDQKRIAHVESNVQPCKADPCPSVPPHAVAKYVLEVAAGVAGKHHLAAGQPLRFEGLEKVVVR
jgi:uncharacterized membrane protein (UPF0127 family)